LAHAHSHAADLRRHVSPVIRPQSKKAKEHQKMLTELQKGDDVATTGGLIGRITG